MESHAPLINGAYVHNMKAHDNEPTINKEDLPTWQDMLHLTSRPKKVLTAEEQRAEDIKIAKLTLLHLHNMAMNDDNLIFTLDEIVNLESLLDEVINPH